MMQIGDFRPFRSVRRMERCVGAAVPMNCVSRGYPKDLQTFGVFFRRSFKWSAVVRRSTSVSRIGLPFFEHEWRIHA